MSRLTLVISLALLAGCASNARRIDARAETAGLQRHEIVAAGHRSLIYMKRGSAPFMVFLEGDGLPWRAGLEPSADPTTGRPIALELLLHTPHAGAYVTRPCYHALEDRRCSPDLWTGARYSAEVVQSVVAAIREAALMANADSMTIIGYSGGGALAVLAAERLGNVDAVITVAANLDIDAWSMHHGYLPLAASLNPALSERSHSWTEIHLQGAGDLTVPPSTTAAYFARFPSAQRRVIEDYDHICCWVADWATILP